MTDSPENPRVLKYSRYEQSKLKLEDCNINESNSEAIMYSIFNMGRQLRGISFSNNIYFNEKCLKQLIDVLPNMKLLTSLELAKVNVSD